MKSFLDKFRRKGPEEDEPRLTESARDLAAEALKKRAQAGQKQDSATEAPAPTGPGSPAASTNLPPSASPTEPTATRDETITFTLGDFLPRIPTQLLTASEHDAAMPLTFDAGELSNRIARGQTTISLAEIYKRAPKVFRGEIRESDNIEIRFPWQKLLEMVKTSEPTATQPRISEAAAEALAQKLRGRKRGASPEAASAPANEPKAPAAPQRQPTWFSRPTPMAVPTAPSPAETKTPEPAEASGAANLAPSGSLAPVPPRAAPLPGLTPAPLPVAPVATLPTAPPAPVAPLASPAAFAPLPVAAEPAVGAEIERITRETEKEVERLRSGYEQTIGQLKEELTAIKAERDEVRERLKTASFGPASAAGADVAALQRELEALKAATQAKDRELNALQKQLDEHQLLTGTEVASLSQERDEHRQTREVREQELTALRAEADTRDRELNTLRDRLSKVEQAAQTAAQERDSQRLTLDATAKEYSALKAEVENRTRELAQTQATLLQFQKGSEGSVTAAAKERDEFRAVAEARQKELTALHQKLIALEQSAQATAQQQNAERSSLEVSSKELAALKTERDELRAAAEARQKELTAVQEKLIGVEQAAQAAQAAAQAAAQQQDAQRSSLDASSKEVAALKAERDSLSQNLNQMREKVAELERHHGNTSAMAASITSERDQFRTEAGQKSTELTALQTKLTQAEEAIRLASQEREAQSAKLAENAAKLAENAKEIEALYGDAARYDKQLEQEKSHFHQLQKTVEAALASLTAERDQARAESAGRGNEIAALQKRIEQFSQAAKAELAETDAERDRLRTEHETVVKNLTFVRTELEALQAKHTSELQALTVERDALTQQKQQLTEQVNTLQNVDASRGEAHRAEGERSQREHQRQAEELQRRIIALETTQREVAQELSREREAKIKAERIAAQADRARSEAATLVESTRNDARRDLDNAVRKREAEFARSQKEIQEKLDAQLAAYEKLKIERDALATERDHFATAHQTGTAEFTSLKAGHEAVSSEAGALREERNRLSAEFNELQGRLTAAEEKLAAQQQQSATELENVKRQLESEQQQHQADREIHTRELAQAREEAAIAAKLREHVGGLEAGKSTLDQQLAEITQQRDAARKRVERLQRELDEVLANPPVNPTLTAELDRTKAALVAAEERHGSGAAELAKLKAEAERQIAALQEAQAAEVQRVRNEANLTSRTLGDRLAAAERGRTDLEQQLVGLRQQHTTLKAEADQLRSRPAVDPSVSADLDRAQSDLAAARQKIDSLTADLSQQRDTAREQIEKFQAELGELRGRPAVDPAVAADLDRTKGELAEARQKIEALTGDLSQQRDAARKRVEKLQAELDEFHQRPSIDPAVASDFERTKGELTAARQKIEALAAELDDQRRKATAQLNDFEQAKTAIESNLTDLSQQRDAARKRVEKLQAEVDELLQRPAVDPTVAAAFEATKQQLADTTRHAESVSTQRDEHGREVARLREEAVAAAEIIEQLRQQHSRVESAHASLQENLSAVVRDRDTAVMRARTINDRLQAVEATVAAREAELAHIRNEMEKSVASARSEIDAATEAMRQERDQLLTELAATRERSKTVLSNNAKEHRNALAALAEERDAARRESLSVAQRVAELRVELDQKAAQHQRDIELLKTQFDKLSVESAKAQEKSEQQSAAFVRELKSVTEQRDKAVAAAARAEQEIKVRTTGADESRAQAERLAAERVGRLEREVTRMKRERDQLIEQRDEYRDRIASMADAQQRLVKEIGLQATKTAKSLPTDVVQKPEAEPATNVIDISEAEVLQPGEPDPASGGIRPQVRPRVTPPPNLRVL